MKDTTADPSSLAVATPPVAGGHLLAAIGLAGLAVGVLDATDGVVYFGVTQGLNPIQVLQFIASGALGPAAFTGGLLTAAAGAGFHFAIAYASAAVYAVAYARVRECATIGLSRAWPSACSSGRS